MPMQIYTYLTPERCLERAEAFAETEWPGGNVTDRTDDSITFELHQMPGCGEWILMTLITIFTLGIGLAWAAFRIWTVIKYPAQAKLTVRASEDGRTRLLVDGRHSGYREELAKWVRQNLVTGRAV